MTDQNDQTSALKSERKRFISFAFAASELLFEIELDEPHRIKFASGATSELTGRSESDLDDLPFLNLFAQQDATFVLAILARLKTNGRIAPIAIKMQMQNGNFVDAVVGGFCMPGDSTMFLSVNRSERLWGLETRQAQADSETGLMEKDDFIRAARDRGISAAGLTGSEKEMMLLVVEELDTLREKHGEEAVQEFLKNIGVYLRSISTGGTTAGELENGRFGAVTEKTAEPEETKETVQKVVQEQAKKAGLSPVKLQNYNIDLKVEGLTSEDSAKALGYALNKFITHSNNEPFNIRNLADASQAYLSDTIGRLAFLRRSMSGSHMKIAFQPIVDLKNRQAWKYEALVRLDGFSSPAKMVGFAEDVGLSDEFDLIVLSQVIDILKEKKKVGWRPNVTVNLSVRSLSSRLFIASVKRLFEPYKDLIKQVGFEITETSSIADLDLLDTAIQELREQGHEVCLDDLGSGRTSFEAVKFLKCDYAKIDGDYIQNFNQDDRHRSILETIVQTCHALKMTMVAEKVEDEDTARALAKMGIQYGQGYLFGKPSLGGDALSYSPPKKGGPKGVHVGWS